MEEEEELVVSLLLLGTNTHTHTHTSCSAAAAGWVWLTHFRLTEHRRRPATRRGRARARHSCAPAGLQALSWRKSARAFEVFDQTQSMQHQRWAPHPALLTAPRRSHTHLLSVPPLTSLFSPPSLPSSRRSTHCRILGWLLNIWFVTGTLTKARNLVFFPPTAHQQS